MSDSYRTPAGNSRTEIKVKRSRFIGTVEYAPDLDAAKDFISRISREFHDATHNCYAYRIGLGSSQAFKYSDDGEPSGTAGRPILEVIDRHELMDVCVVVTRYFGGIKLGTGGLGRAYRDAALAAIEQAGIETKYLTKRLKFTFHLHFTNIVLRTLSSEVCNVVDSVYTDTGAITCDIRQSSVEKIRNTLIAASNGKIEIEEV